MPSFHIKKNIKQFFFSFHLTMWYAWCPTILWPTTDINPESSDNYLIGHCIDGRVLYPATGYLVLAWRTLVRNLGVVMEITPVTFEDITIHRATILPKTGESRAAVVVGVWSGCRGSLVVMDWWAAGILLQCLSDFPSVCLCLSVSLRLCPVGGASHACHQQVWGFREWKPGCQW